MNKNYLIPTLLGAVFQLALSQTSALAQAIPTEIAFLSDIHLQDVYADLNSKEFRGVFNPKTGKYATIRTMKSQLNSTRLFNENYFALLSALENLKENGVQLVVLPGDFTDDGQPMNVLALKKILDHYSRDFGMRFFITTGNHDPVKPFGGTAGKRDFLGENGSEQAIAGKTGFYSNRDLAVSAQINYWGYKEITEALSNFGFFPSEKDLFWAHPFQQLDVDGYTYFTAKESARLENRVYEVGDSGKFLPDASYVIEPVDGIWLLALDGNVYTPNHEQWKGSSIGFNQAFLHKKHQLDWIKKVSQEAKKRGKKLISFSHYPLVEFHDQASKKMKQLFGTQKFQLARVPDTSISEAYLKAGITLHFAGHMHINDTGIFEDTVNHQRLYNIQVPSLAAFPPAYKILKIDSSSSLEIETELLYDVEQMDEFFDLYRMERKWLSENQDPKIWDSTILASQDYFDYTRKHLLELTKSRFIPSDWPESLAKLLQELNENEILEWSRLDEKAGEELLKKSLKQTQTGKQARLSSKVIIDDFYLVKNGDEIGKNLISSERKAFYEKVFGALSPRTPSTAHPLSHQLHQFFSIFDLLFNSQPSDHFSIDLQKNSIQNLAD